MSVGFAGVANFANTYPGAAIRVVANVDDGWGDAVGGATVICQGGVTPSDYFIDLENSSGYVLMESTGGILLEIA